MMVLEPVEKEIAARMEEPGVLECIKLLGFADDHLARLLDIDAGTLELFRDDVLKLQDWLDRDLSAWLE